MRYTSNIAAVAAVVSVAVAGDAPVAQASNIDTSYSATIQAAANSLSGNVLGALAPGGAGTNFQIAFYNLPGTGNLSYALHVDRITNNDCSTAGAVLDPYGGITGSKCATDLAACQVGDLSDKHGAATILSGGSGTGYFSANYPDEYVSMEPSNKAFFGKGSFVVTDENGAAVACANFVSTLKQSLSGNSTTTSSTMGTAGPTGTAGSNSQNQQSSSTSSGFAARTAAPVVGAGVLGLAALFL